MRNAFPRMRCRRSILLFANKLQNLVHLCTDGVIIFPLMRSQAGGAVFDALFGVAVIAAAFVAQAVQRAVAEQAAKAFRIGGWVAGKIFTLFILKEIVMCHNFTDSAWEAPLSMVMPAEEAAFPFF